MKKPTISLVLTVCAIVAMMLSPASAGANSFNPTTLPPTSGNLLRNAGFEQIFPPNWQAASFLEPLEIAQVRQVYAGRYSAEIVGHGTNDTRIRQQVAVAKNSYYQLDGWVKTKNVVSDPNSWGVACGNLAVEDIQYWIPKLGNSNYHTVAQCDTSGLNGTKEWQYHTLVFCTNDADSLFAEGRNGGFGALTLDGSLVWVDSLRLRSLWTSHPCHDTFAYAT